MNKFWLKNFRCAAYGGNDRLYVIPCFCIGIERVKPTQWAFIELYFLRFTVYVEFVVYK
jgi:hypothetical protein